ncbi:MAG TPA: amidase [Candidatus Cloacimonadota bacterium]|nr:amidase [Candidatus Cloacimonadota bacterium]
MFYERASLSELSIALRNNTLDLFAYINHVCDRVETIDKEIHALLPERNRRKRLLSEANALINKYPLSHQRPQLFGVLVGVKDLFNVDGMLTKAGSKLPAEVFTGPEASLVTALKAAGALILGKTHTTEFAYFTPAPTRNPVNPEHTPGGSSSGSAAAVAAGFVPLALGTQTIASIIRPAAYCGIIGFKPSYGRMAMDGVFPFAQSVDQAGFFTQDISGATLASSVLVKNWNSDIRTNAKPRLFLPADAYLAQADYDAFNRFYEQADILNENGFEITQLPFLKDIRTLNHMHQTLIAAEFYLNHKKLYKEYGDLYSEHSKALYERGSKVSKDELSSYRLQLRQTRADVKKLMSSEGVDAWICPAATSAAPRGLSSTGSPLMSLPWTWFGLPSITIPAGHSSHDLPLGLQIVGGQGRDERLLQDAAEIFHTFSYGSL